MRRLRTPHPVATAIVGAVLLATGLRILLWGGGGCAGILFVTLGFACLLLAEWVRRRRR